MPFGAAITKVLVELSLDTASLSFISTTVEYKTTGAETLLDELRRLNNSSLAK